MRETVFGRCGQFVIMKIDADDRLRSSQLGSEHRTEPDAPYPKDDHRLARFDLRVVVDDSKTGGKCVGEQTAKFEISVGGNLGQTIFGNDRVLLECGDRTGIHLASIPFIDGTARIDSRPRTPVADNTITRRDVRRVLTNLKNDSPSFMSEEMRKKFIRTLDPIDLADLRSANARGVDFDQHLPALERRQLDFVDDQRLALLNQNGGGRFQNTVLATD